MGAYKHAAAHGGLYWSITRHPGAIDAMPKHTCTTRSVTTSVYHTTAALLHYGMEYLCEETILHIIPYVFACAHLQTLKLGHHSITQFRKIVYPKLHIFLSNTTWSDSWIPHNIRVHFWTTVRILMLSRVSFYDHANRPILDRISTYAESALPEIPALAPWRVLDIPSIMHQSGGQFTIPIMHKHEHSFDILITDPAPFKGYWIIVDSLSYLIEETCICVPIPANSCAIIGTIVPPLLPRNSACHAAFTRFTQPPIIPSSKCETDKTIDTVILNHVYYTAALPEDDTRIAWTHTPRDYRAVPRLRNADTV